jgi:V8-like Glu-specific endopeptidase
MLLDNFQIQQTLKRYKERSKERERNERLIKEKRFLAIDSPERVDKFLRRRGLAPNIEGGLTIERVSKVMAGEVAGLPPELAMERYLGTNDLMGVAFLEQGLNVARTIARIWVNVAGGRPAAYGTGFLVSPRLLITNHHVLGDSTTAGNSLAEFNYQRRIDGTLINSTSFPFEPHVFFYANQELDYAVVAVRGTSADGRSLTEFGHNLLSEDEGKAIAAQWANIIQHPGGEPKQVSLRENQIVDVLPNYLHYKSDTAPGSSGAAIYNDRWEIVGLHHSGVYDKTADGQIMAVDGTAWRPEMGEDRIKWIANEGVRISRIIKHLRDQLADDTHRALFNAMLAPSNETQPMDKDRTTHLVRDRSGQSAVLTTTPDGAATWTIPLTVSVNVGGRVSADAPAGGTAALYPPVATYAPTAPPPVSPPEPGDGHSPNEVLAAARTAFMVRSNVMGVRLGFVFKDGRITQERALVVTVRAKKSVADLVVAGIEELPTTFGGIKVQVTDPTIAELIVDQMGFAASEALALSVDMIAAEITYKPPRHPGLNRVKARMKVTAHIGPDAGWTQLKGFLEGTTKTLTVGMYDFGARHIAEAIEDAGSKRGFKNMTLTLQPGQSVGTGTKANDLTDKEAVQQLSDALKSKFKNAWVKIGLVNGWVASSYHIKVAVRDSSAFWLSSGNWQSSNQPQADPLKKPWDRKWLTQYNREWHTIVEHHGLAADYERYLQHDFNHNVGIGTDEAMILPDLLLPDEAFMPTLTERAAPFKYFEPLSETRVFDVQPLLTPDNYHTHTLELINSAEEELLIQNQTFNAPKESHQKLRELLSAILTKQNAGVSVRIIFRIFMKADARKNLEALQEFGFDMASIKVQKNCHTKGIIVDRKRVMIGSQNLSEQGVSLNRDASLLFEDAKLAAYFAEIFEHDWANLASDSIDIAPSGAELAETAESTLQGYTKISVEEYLESL